LELARHFHRGHEVNVSCVLWLGIGRDE
jgi:hypothetical protein